MYSVKDWPWWAYIVAVPFYAIAWFFIFGMLYSCVQMAAGILGG